MDQIKTLTKEETSKLPFDANWIGTLGTNSNRHYVKTKAQALCWVKRIQKNWPGQWAVYECFHFKTGKSIGWGATAL